MSGTPGSRRSIQPSGQVVLNWISQYWMNTTPAVPSLKNTDCSQPRQFGFGEPLHAELVNMFGFSCTSYASLTGLPMLTIFELSLVTLVTLWNEPIACEMVPDGACAEISLPRPIVNGRGP